MPNEDWGVKRACPKCATRFYDLNSDPMVCPSCAHSFTRASLLEVLRGRASAKSKVDDKPTAVATEDDVDVDLLDDDDDSDSGDDLLEDDDDDETVGLDDIADVASKDDD